MKCYRPRQIDLRPEKFSLTGYHAILSATHVDSDQDAEAEDQDVLTYDGETGLWTPKPQAAGTSENGAHLAVQFPSSILPLGPKNVLARIWRVIGANVVADGAVEGTATGVGAFSIGAGGNAPDGTDYTDLDVEVAQGSRLELADVIPGEDVNYLCVTWIFRSETL